MTRRHLAAALAVLALLALPACSSHAAPAPPAAPIAAAAPQPTGPSPAACTAVRDLVAGAQPGLAAVADAPVGQQAVHLSAFYTQLLLALTENAAADPASAAVERDASALADGYGALSNALQSADASGATAALQGIVANLDAMRRDEVAFDAVCGVPAIVH